MWGHFYLQNQVTLRRGKKMCAGVTSVERTFDLGCVIYEESCHYLLLRETNKSDNRQHSLV